MRFFFVASWSRGRGSEILRAGVGRDFLEYSCLSPSLILKGVLETGDRGCWNWGGGGARSREIPD